MKGHAELVPVTALTTAAIRASKYQGLAWSALRRAQGHWAGVQGGKGGNLSFPWDSRLAYPNQILWEEGTKHFLSPYHKDLAKK